MSQYLNLNLKGGAPARLCMMRETVARAHADNMPPSRSFADWRAVRADSVSIESFDGLHAGQQSNGARIWYSHGATGLREQRYCDEVSGARIRHTGWFADSGFIEKVRGVVALLPHGRFVAGYEGSAGDTVIFDKVHTDEVEAARMADEHARVQAEQEKAYSERWQAARDLADNIESERTEIGRLFELRNSKRFGTLELREELNAHIRELRRMRATLAENFADIEL